MKIIKKFSTPMLLYIKEYNHNLTTNFTGIPDSEYKNLPEKQNTATIFPYTLNAYRSYENKIDKFSNTSSMCDVNISKLVEQSKAQSHSLGLNAPVSVEHNSFDGDSFITSIINFNNFTGIPVVVRDIHNIPKTIPNIDKLPINHPHFANKFIIYTTYILNNFMCSDFHLNELRKLYTQLKNNNTLINEQSSIIVKYILDNHTNIRTDGKSKAVNLYVTSILLLNKEELFSIDSKNVFLPVQNIVVSSDNLLNSAEHPSASDIHLNVNSKDELKIQNNTLSIFIVDNSNEIKEEKYMVVLDKIIAIPKVTSKTMLNGFYIRGYLNEKKEVRYLNVEDMKKCKYLFNSVEEAEEFLNIEKRLEFLEIEKNKLKHSHETEKIELEKKALQEKTRLLSEESKVDHLKYTFDRNRIEEDLRKSKYKDELEYKSYQRESMLETLKVIGVVFTCGVIAYKLIEQFKK